MPVLVSPATYVTADDFLSMPLDYNLDGYTDDQVTDILVRASGIANAILKRSLLATERLQRFRGNGTSRLSLHARPLLYVRSMQFVVPGLIGAAIPLDRVNIDYELGTIEVVRPLALQGVGYEPFFPERVPIDISFAAGYGYDPYEAPQWSAVDTNAGVVSLAPGQYLVGVTTRTPWGETTPTLQTVTTASGAFTLTITPALGAYSYRVYAAPLSAAATADPTQLTLVGEVPSATFTDGPSTYNVSSLATPAFTYPAPLSLTDTAAPPLPQEIREAIRLLAMQQIYEQNNLSNRGIARTESGRKSVQWRSTEGSGGRGVPLYFEQASQLLAPFAFSEVY